MREAMKGSGGLVGTESKYATLSLTASTSRNCTVSAPGTTPERQVLPPFDVTAKVPKRPLAQTTREFAALTAIRLDVVPLCWTVTFGPLFRWSASCSVETTAPVSCAPCPHPSASNAAAATSTPAFRKVLPFIDPPHARSSEGAVLLPARRRVKADAAGEGEERRRMFSARPACEAAPARRPTRGRSARARAARRGCVRVRGPRVVPARAARSPPGPRGRGSRGAWSPPGG